MVRYPIADQFTFLLPTMIMLALAAGVGVAALADASRAWRIVAIAACAFSIAAPPAFYAVAPSIVRGMGMELRRARELPFRDELRYWLVPWKHNESSAEKFAAAALQEASPDGVILPDGTSRPPLVLVQYRDGLARGVSVQHGDKPLPPYDRKPESFRQVLGERPLYLVAPTPGHAPRRLLEDAEFIRADGAVLYRARWKGH